MEFRTEGPVEFVQFESFQEFNIVHGIFKRHGGVSPPPWDSLNVGNTVGDSPDHALENLRTIFNICELPLNSIHQVWQVHSPYVALVRTPSIQGLPQKADGMVTDSSEVSLFMRFADCVPILLYDPNQRAIGIAHAGWLGTVRKSASAVLRAMVERFGTQPRDVMAGLGPSIGPDHYIVGEDVVSQFMNSFPATGRAFIESINGNYHLNLWHANQALLEQEGVRNVEIAEICTACHPEDWFSHRAERGKTGRFGALISLGSR